MYRLLLASRAIIPGYAQVVGTPPLPSDPTCDQVYPEEDVLLDTHDKTTPYVLSTAMLPCDGVQGVSMFCPPTTRFVALTPKMLAVLPVLVMFRFFEIDTLPPTVRFAGTDRLPLTSTPMAFQANPLQA